ncbi:MAG: DUF1624 domain-containing protein [Firmicutes bacterium]|nr:DUF1624 domain-containing protein [Bacillota bacterium]
MFKERWNDLTPSRRCDWIDQLRGWAVIVMIEVHVVNVWLHQGLAPGWLNYLNGLVAPSFTMAAGFSLAISTFKFDGTLRPFWPDTVRRLGFILLCAYALHAPGITLADWTVLGTAQKFRELFKIDVLQCIVFSLLLLQGLARLVRNPKVFTALALFIAIGVPLVSPSMWATGVADGLWLPIRGLFNGNPDRGVQALFPLFPWVAFPAFGAFLGGLYRHFRVEPIHGQARWSEARYLVALALLGAALLAWGQPMQQSWLWKGTWFQQHGVWMLQSKSGAFTYAELSSIGNTTLPSVAARLGWILMGGAVMGLVELLRRAWPGPNPIKAASNESLLLYMLHLNMLFSVLLAPVVVGLTGWGWYSLGWVGTLTMTAVVIALNLWAGVVWQNIRKTPDFMRRLQRLAVAVLGVWFVVGGWWTVRHYVTSPELAKEPYLFLNAARVRKGLPPTTDGLSHDPKEAAQEKARRGLRLNDEERRLLESTL